ncbi:MAG: SH3 domain-containing protein, partial [Anaerolineales bacterium]
MHSFQGEGEQELSINEGEYVLVLSQEDNGWCLGHVWESQPSAKLPGMGWLPLSYLEPAP